MTLPEGISCHDISSEAYREYVYADGTVYRVDNPRTLYLKRAGNTHRVVDYLGVTHYPSPTWVALRWKSDPEVSF
jgi:hypothetical protein